jgi:class 3 adenylate cyclase/tetratricopeptide (TPR) repeat protein
MGRRPADRGVCLQVTTETARSRSDSYVPRMLLGRLARPADELVETLEGTMVFADVSGFTRLSERLARKGKEGAEYLVDAINACFSALLADAYGRGGSLLKFGGDAMLLWFAGDEHALRACASANEMRRTLREVGRIRAGVSDVVLRMSVGVHSGPYAMFLVGASHRELLIGGPATSTVVEMESIASAGQILVSHDTAVLLPRGCVGAAVGSGRLLARPPAPSDWEPRDNLAMPADEAIAACLPAIVRPHLLGGHAAPEHRTASVAFLQFTGLDRLIRERGSEEAGCQLDRLVREVQTACDRYEVCFLDSDISADGAKIRLSAGAPRVVGDDDERMLLALRQILGAELVLPVKVGVNRGPVFSGEVGPDYRRWYAVMGDTVNLAARVMGKAPTGRIYATRDVVRQVQGRFRLIALEPFAVKGKARPVQAWDVGIPLRAGVQGMVRPPLPLVGRDRDLNVLLAAVDAARRGSGGLIELIGETGSGKTRLLAEARELGSGMRVLRSSCEVASRESPYFPWRQLLRQLLDVGWDDPAQRVREGLESEIRGRQPDLMPWLPLIAIVVDIDVPSTVEVEQLAAEARASKLREVVLRFLGRALVVPTIVEVEHAHLMDAASAALFEALSGELGSSSWVVLITRQDVAGGLMLPTEEHHRIELAPLSRDDVLALAHATDEAAALPPHVVELAVERSGGSPEFLLDLLAAAAAGDRDELPESVGAATMARIDALDPRDRAVVRRAAVLGVHFHPRRLADVLAADMSLPEDGFWDRLSSVFAREPDGHVRFKRPAIQEVAYASLPFKLRRELHMAVGLRLEHDLGRELDAGPAMLSHHFSLAGDYARAHRYAMAAARRATEQFSHADAARLYRRAIEAGRASGIAGDPRSMAEAWEQLGDALRNVGEPAAAARALSEARKLVREDPVDQARLLYLHAEVAERSAALTAAVRWLKRGFRSVDGVQSREATVWRARMRSKLAGIRGGQGRWNEAIRECRLAIAEAESVEELSALAHACYVLDWVVVESGRPDEAVYSPRALEIYERLGDPAHEAITLNNLGMFAYWEGRWDDAIDLYRRAGACGERAGRPADAAFTDCNVGEILSDQGHLDEAEAHLRQARRVWSGTGEQQAVAFVDVLLARLAVRRGQSREGAAMLEAAEAELRRLGIDAYAEFAHTLIAEAEAFGGDPFRALEMASQALQANDRERPLLTRMGGIALARLGQTSAALRELRHSLETARARSGEYDIASTIDVMDALGGADPDLLRERDEILARLQIERLPTPVLMAAV